MNTADDGGSKADANNGGASDVGVVTIKMPNNNNGRERGRRRRKGGEV